MRGLVREIVLTLSRQVASALLQFATLLVIARYLGPVGNGLYQMALYLPALLLVVANPGLGAAIVYHVAKRRDDAAVLRAALGIIGLAALLGLVVGLFAMIFGADLLFAGVPRALLWIGLAYFPVALAAVCAQAVLQGREDYRRYNAAIIAAQAVTLVLVWWQLESGGGARDALLCALAGAVVGLVLALWFVGSRWRLARADPALTRGIFDYGSKAYAASLVAFVNYRLDLFIVNFFLGALPTGIYVVAVRLGEYLWLVSIAVSTIVFPRLSAPDLPAAERRSLILVSFRVTLLISALAGVGLVVIASPLVRLALGPAYAAVLQPLWVLIPGIVLFGASRIVSNALAARGRPEINAWIATVICVVNVVLSLWLVPRYGIVGAAAATSLCYAADFLVKIVLIGRLEQIGAAEFLPARTDFRVLRQARRKAETLEPEPGGPG